MFQPRILADKSILVTGGGSGLGLAMAKTFVSYGAQVSICGRKRDRLEAASKEIAAAAREGGEVAFFAADVREPAQVETLVAGAVERFGRVDALVNNAAGNFLVLSEDLTPNGFDAVVRTVLHGSVYCSLAVGRHLLARGAPGAIVSIAATYASSGSGTAYALPSASAKAGVLAMTRSLAVEWGGAGIRVNAIAPGPIPTEGAFSRLMPTPEAQRASLDRIPLGRFGRPEEVANLAVFLLSDACPYQTGDCVTMDGGEWLAGAGEFSGYRRLPREEIRAAFDAMRPPRK